MGQLTIEDRRVLISELFEMQQINDGEIDELSLNKMMEREADLEYITLQQVNEQIHDLKLSKPRSYVNDDSPIHSSLQSSGPNFTSENGHKRPIVTENTLRP